MCDSNGLERYRCLNAPQQHLLLNTPQPRSPPTRSDPPVPELQQRLPRHQAAAHLRHAQLQVLGGGAKQGGPGRGRRRSITASPGSGRQVSEVMG